MKLLVLRRPSRPSRHDRGLAYGSRAGCGGPEEKEVGLGVSVPVSRVWTPHDLKKKKIVIEREGYMYDDPKRKRRKK